MDYLASSERLNIGNGAYLEYWSVERRKGGSLGYLSVALAFFWRIGFLFWIFLFFTWSESDWKTKKRSDTHPTYDDVGYLFEGVCAHLLNYFWMTFARCM